MDKSLKTHKLYRCLWCSIELSWRRVITNENGVVCPICDRPVSELDVEAVDIDEVLGCQDAEKEEEELTPPRPSWLYRCSCCWRYVPWNKVEAVIRRGKIILYRCPFCGEEAYGEKTAATWLDEQYNKENVSKIRSFVFKLKGDPCPECAIWPFPCKAEIGYPLGCENCGATLIDFLCWSCVHGKHISEPDCCRIKHVTGRVTFCWDFKQNERTKA